MFNDYKTSSYGLKRENDISFELKNANLGLYVIKDLNISYNYLEVQIDFVVISSARCECTS